MANLVHFIPLLTFTTILLMLLINKAHSSDSLSFNYDSFSPDQKDLILQGDSQILSSNILQLTRETQQTVGRALYIAPVHLWEKGTGKVASFETKFTFILNSSKGNPADGIAFFLAPIDTTIPHGSAGGYLGLFSPYKLTNALNTSSTPVVKPNQVVAVEFDSYYTSNSWDPKYRHIGIDLNTIKSSAVTRWERREGAIVSVLITYTPATGILRVESCNPGTRAVSLSQKVDLKTYLPEWVRVGFSASTGDVTQRHSVLSWSFTSKFESNSEANYKDDVMYNIIRDVTDV